MSKTLVVVESPAKAKTIEKVLGKNYTVKASMGHLRDLPKSQFGINIEENFTPKYINIRGKGDLIKSLKEAAKRADKVYLASDPDREGEAIAWHLAHILGIPEDKKCRIEFYEITKPAIKSAVRSPRPINMDRVDAQQARRMLDRIVGYQLSPLLWRKVRKGLSAGRVQSVTVKMICDREQEILEFIPEEYWTIGAYLRKSEKYVSFEAQLVAKDDKKIEIHTKAEADAILADLTKSSYEVADVKKRERKRNPAPPFTTSSLQQEAARKLGFTSKKTMMLAQQLYEGLELGKKGPVGLITYMRTDSVRVSELAQAEARELIGTVYGAEYVPAEVPSYSAKKSQDAHEAIRPTTMALMPKDLTEYLSRDQLRLYRLIWERFMASQMVPAVYDTVTVDIGAGRYGLKAVGSHLKFAGFMMLYSESKDKKETNKDVTLPPLEVGQKLEAEKFEPKQHFTEPPPRYTEASLVKALEEKGIGRPSTYSPTIETILSRGYVDKEDKKFVPTELGFVVTDLLKEYFLDIVDIPFTVQMETQLDEIAEGKYTKEEVLGRFYEPFAETLAKADEAIGHVELPVEVSDVKCEQCGEFMVVKQGRFGKFLACPNFPTCRNTKPIVKDMGVTCHKCGGHLVERQSKRGRIFYGCDNWPECDFVTWDVPLKETCPECGTFLLGHGYRGKFTKKYCANEACPTRAGEKTEKPKKPATRKRKTASKSEE
ncbi:MAG: type I DNA topoisomerase [Selenomonadales bacterium]|nr:type I DNA topoisomerase [Selenomonadales bacterium]